MDFHLEHGLRLHTQSEHKNLYQWAINEIDAQGQRIGHDQIPWPWTSHFTATSCVLRDSIDVKSQFQTEQITVPAKVVQGQVIRVELRSGRLRDFRKTTFSMFGTSRDIKSFQLEIHPIADPAEQESCNAWGSVSYTREIDFRNETTDDCIIFYMFVKPDTFGRYAAKVVHGSVDEMIFSVGSVAGFYSEWSPSISTDHVKVLTEGSAQNITLPPDHQVEPPRLGQVGAAELYINRRLEFGKPAPESEAVKEMTQASGAAVDPRVLEMLGSLRSLRQAAWFIVCLLTLIFIVTLLKH